MIFRKFIRFGEGMLPLWLGALSVKDGVFIWIVRYGNFCTNDENCGIVAATSVPATLVTLLHPQADAKAIQQISILFFID